MEEILVTALIVLGLGAIGGVIRTMRDTYKKYMQYDNRDLQTFFICFDFGDVFFDIFFGVVVGGVTWFGIADDELTKASVFAVVTAAYAGADVIDGIFKPKK